MKKILALPLAAVLTVGVLTGCSNSDKDTATPPSSSAPAIGTPTETPTSSEVVVDVEKISKAVEDTFGAMILGFTDEEATALSDSVEAMQAELAEKGIQYNVMDDDVSSLTDEQLPVALEGFLKVENPLFDNIDFTELTTRENVDLRAKATVYIAFLVMFSSMSEGEGLATSVKVNISENDVEIVDGSNPTVRVNVNPKNVVAEGVEVSDETDEEFAVFTMPENEWLLSGKYFLEELSSQIA